MSDSRKFSKADILFVAGCALAYAIVVLIVPPYTPLTDQDSTGYIAFNPMRPAIYPAFLALCRALGLSLVATTWVQLAIFAVALAFFLSVLLRSGFPKWMLGILVALLAGNVLYSSFHRSILSESLYFSLSLVALALWIAYFRTGGLGKLMTAGLALGLMIGIRVAGVALLPLHLVTLWIRPPRRFPVWLSLVLSLLPVAAGYGGERLLYYAAHGPNFESQAPFLLTGKAALLIRPDMKFSGPHAETLNRLGAQLYAVYGPIQRIIAQAPSLPVRALLSSDYEGLAQYFILADEFAAAARAAHTSAVTLREELARQVIRQNLSGYVELTLLEDIGQWSVAMQNFPPVARALGAYADAHPEIALGGRIPAAMLHPRASLTGAIVYPAFLAIGVATLLLAFGFIVFLIRPSLAHSETGFYLMLATFLSAMCHASTLFISLVNLWTPRYLMAVFPQLEIVALCILLLLIRTARRAAP